MSASLFWIPISSEKHALSCGQPSRFIAAMQRAFGEGRPWRIGAASVPILTGMAAAWGDGPERGEMNPFTQLIDAIRDGDGSRTIEVWPEY